MSNSSFDSDQLLLRLMNNELSKEELRQLADDQDFQGYKTILDEVDTWTLPALDLEESYERLKNKRTPGKAVSWYQTNLFRIAAAVAIILVSTVVLLFNSDSIVKIETKLAETENVLFPDGSSVVLGASSQLTYDEEKWDILRELDLSGTAYFDVVNGKPFKVKFALGTVEVLGTAFEIKSFNNYASIMCYDGSVLVKSDSGNAYIAKGEGITLDSIQKSESFDFPDTTWSKDIVRFQGAPLSVVFKSLSSQFGIEINPGKVDLSRKFSGVYVTEDVDRALKMVCQPMNIKYDRNKNSVTLQ